jgi:hypothetical protein
MLRRAVLPLLLAVLLLPGAAARAEDGTPAPIPSAPEAAPDPVEGALRDVASPWLTVREAAVVRLEALVADPAAGARERVIAAFRRAPEGSREPLARVLAGDGSRPALAALLDELPRSRDPADGAAIRYALVRHAERVAEGVRAWRAEHGKTPPAVEDLERLLLRARLEARFLSRKSRSGSTGYYRGQYDDLLPDRQAALELVLAVLEDREPRRLRRPGEVPTGVFRFLRPPGFLVTKWEARAMAVNAVGELLRKEDVAEIRRLHAYLVRLGPELPLLRDRNMPGPDDDLYDATLAILYRMRRDVPAGSGDEDLPHDPEEWYAETADRRLAELESLSRGTDSAAVLALRMGRYPMALEYYRDVIRGGVMLAMAYYNVACVHANWSLEEGLAERQRADNRALAVRSLALAVSHGYVDWPWMEQDRDLDPIRGDPLYKALLERLQKEFRAPAMDGR